MIFLSSPLRSLAAVSSTESKIVVTFVYPDRNQKYSDIETVGKKCDFIFIRLFSSYFSFLLHYVITIRFFIHLLILNIRFDKSTLYVCNAYL